jgi:DNA invertase Pin-like site-specific DNA recombinase
MTVAKRTRKFFTREDVTPEMINQVKKLYVEEGKGVSTITRLTSITSSTVEWILKENGVTLRKRNEGWAWACSKSEEKKLLWPYAQESLRSA